MIGKKDVFNFEKNNNQMKNLKIQSLVLSVALLLSIGCKHDNAPPQIVDPTDPTDTTTDPVDPVDPVDPGITCDPDTTYFVNDILPLLTSSCALSGCHNDASAQDGVVLTTYNKIMNTGEVEPFDLSDSEIYEMITEDDNDDRMPPPPYPRLSNDQIAMVADWILQGALNNECNENAGGCDVSNVTFSNAVMPIINLKCKGCHSGTSPSGGINLTTHAGVKAVAESGQLYGAISWQSGYTHMPFNGPKLPDCEILKVKTWIDAGMPNN